MMIDFFLMIVTGKPVLSIDGIIKLVRCRGGFSNESSNFTSSNIK